MSWRLARSLTTLRAEVNAFAPQRNKYADGTIGDQAHASRASAHNPNNAGVVCALDITHDPAGGMDVHALVRRMVKRPMQPDASYIVSDGEIITWASGWAKWRPYGGSSPHTQHAHFRVGRGPDSEPTPPYDDTDPWGVAPEEEDDMPIDVVHDADAVAAAQLKLINAGLLSRAHAGGDAASVGLLMLLCARLLDMVSIDLEDYELQLVKK